MKILILGVKEFPARGFSRDMGGIDVFTSALTKKLTKRNINFTVITRFLPGLKKEEHLHNLTIFRVPYVYFRLLRAVTYNFFAFLKALKVLKKNKIDVIYTGEIIAGFFATILKKICKIPIVAKIGTFGSKQPEWPFYAKSLLRIFEKKTLSEANAVILTNYEGAKYATELCMSNKERFYVIPNAVDTEKFQQGNAQKIHQEFDISENCFVILFLGRFTESKGLPYLIKAFKILLSKNKINKENMRLLLVGDGVLYSKVKSMIDQLDLGEFVILPGFRRDLPDIMSAANVFCLPSLYEAFPLVILEALSSGLPIVASYIGAIPEVIKNGFNGILVPPKKPVILADAIYNLFNNEKLYNRIRENALQTAKSYTWDNLIIQYLELFEQVLHS